MTEILVDNDSLNQSGVFHTTTGFAFNLDKIEIHILALEIGNIDYCLHRNLGELSQATIDAT